MIKQKRFISELFSNERYFDCITETQRLLNYYQNIPEQNEYQYLINTCYYMGGQYKTVVSRLRDADLEEWDKTGLANLILLSNSYFNLQYYELSIRTLGKIKYEEIASPVRNILLKNKISVLLKNFSYEEILTEIENTDQYITGLFEIYSLDELKENIIKYHELGLKSKWLSVSLSALLPGSGQIYSGKIMDGIVSFLAIAGTAYGSYYFYKHDEKPLAITLTFFTGLFYAGNLYGAYNSVEYINMQLKHNFNNQIMQKYNLSYNPSDYINTEIFK